MARIGETLREARERRGLSIEQVAQDTRISARFLEALENERFEELPAPVYVRGFLRSYASFLGLEPQPLLAQLVGGEFDAAGGRMGLVGGPRPPRSQAVRGQTDPFRRREPASARESGTNDGWAPESPSAEREPPRRAPIAPPSYHEELNPDPFGFERGPAPHRRASAGVLLERGEPSSQGGLARVLVLAACGLAAVVAVLAVAAVLRSGGGGGGSPGAAPVGESSRTVTPAAVIPVGSATPTADMGTTGTPSPSTPLSATPSGGQAETPTAGASPATQSAGATPTPTKTGTPVTTPTPSPLPPTATPTPIPATATPLPPRPSTLSACNLGLEEGKCGPSPARVICFPPFPGDLGVGFNSNWFVDVSGTYPLQPGWREKFVDYKVSVGPLIEVGQRGCE